MYSRPYFLLLALASSALLSCVSKPMPPPFAHYRSSEGEDLASIQMATPLVWSWDDLSTSIQPVFVQKPQVPESAIATTSAESDKYTRQASFNLQLGYGSGLPSTSPASKRNQSGAVTQTGTTNTKGVTQSTNNKDAGSQQSSPQSNGGSNTCSSAASGSENCKNQESGSPATSTGGSNQGQLALADSMTQLEATNALFQEAGLLNNYTKGLIQRREYIPYVVRILLSVTTNHRLEPYDLYLKVGLDVDVDDTFRRDPKFSDYENALAALKNESQHPLIVIPLLVTDALEDTKVSLSSEDTLSLAAKLGAAAAAASASLDIGKTIDSINSAVSNRQNTLFSIGKADDQTLIIRMGANRFGNDYELESKTQAISFVLLVHHSLFPAPKTDEKNNDEKNGADERPKHSLALSPRDYSLPIRVTAEPSFQDALLPDHPAAQRNVDPVKGKNAVDRFVLEITPHAGENLGTDNGTLEIYCPGSQYVVFTDTGAETTGSINGNWSWGNRPVVGYLRATDFKGTQFTFVSETSYQDSNGTIPLKFSTVLKAMQGIKVRRWDTYVFVGKLRTDYSYFDVSQADDRKHPWINCANPIQAVVLPAPAQPKQDTAAASGSATPKSTHSSGPTHQSSSSAGTEGSTQKPSEQTSQTHQ